MEIIPDGHSGAGEHAGRGCQGLKYYDPARKRLAERMPLVGNLAQSHSHRCKCSRTDFAESTQVKIKDEALINCYVWFSR